ncbi:hypothetical protein HDZ31DRAFT_39336 [Schizophyllum fasciatum]
MSETPPEYNSRKATFKMPPASVRDKVAAQEARRQKALEEQKKRRAERFDSARVQLESFANLTLEDEESDEEQGSYVMRDKGVGNYKSVLDEDPMDQQDLVSEGANLPSQFTGKGRRRKGSRFKHKPITPARKPNTKYADRCMYAELLEMSEDTPWDSDGIPADIETGWVAVAPVPVGKRCLAVTSMPSGTGGTVPNTTLRSRLLGKSLIPPFPSPLPHATILDCILDDHWRDNGILHVLDVLKWKGRDMMECETAFRFWWRDMRLSELPPSVTVPSATSTFPSAPFVFRASSCTAATDGLTSASNIPPLLPSPPANPPPPPQGVSGGPGDSEHRFAYPVLFVPIPYHTDTTVPNLLNLVLPLARAGRHIEVPPIRHIQNVPPQPGQVPSEPQEGMDPDGLLLYVAEAVYEQGTSPLASWVPVRGYERPAWPHPASARAGEAQGRMRAGRVERGPNDGPLDVFTRWVGMRVRSSWLRRLGLMMCVQAGGTAVAEDAGVRGCEYGYLMHGIYVVPRLHLDACM